MIGMEIEQNNIVDEIKADLIDRASTLINGTGWRVFERVVQFCPVRTGRLRASIVMVYAGGQVKIYSEGVSYARFIANKHRFHTRAADAVFLEPHPVE